MAVHNSQPDSFQTDSDITIIHPDDYDDDVHNTYVPIITRLIQANHSSESRQTTNPQSTNNNHKGNTRPSIAAEHSYIYIDHGSAEFAEQLEEHLVSYIRDLKKPSNTQLDCDKQLVTRLVDLIRLAYPNNQQKMIELDQIIQEIGFLNDKRHTDQKENLEQSRADVVRLNRMLFPPSTDQQIINGTTRTNSMFSTLHRGYSTMDVDQWTEIEDDAKKLHELVESQKNQINEIISLISQTAVDSIDINPPNPLTKNPTNATTDKPPTTPAASANNSAISNLLKQIINITNRSSQESQSLITTAPVINPRLENNSPGTSPTDSFSTLVQSLTTPTIPEHNTNTTKEFEDKKTVKELPVERPHRSIAIPVSPPPPPSPVEPPNQPIDIPVSPPPPPSPVEPKKCPVCNHEFPPTCNDHEMYDHIERCLFPTAETVEIKDYECPNCTRKFPGSSDKDYLQHLSDCYNRDF